MMYAAFLLNHAGGKIKQADPIGELAEFHVSILGKGDYVKIDGKYYSYQRKFPQGRCFFVSSTSPETETASVLDGQAIRAQGQVIDSIHNASLATLDHSGHIKKSIISFEPKSHINPHATPPKREIKRVYVVRYESVNGAANFVELKSLSAALAIVRVAVKFCCCITHIKQSGTLPSEIGDEIRTLRTANFSNTNAVSNLSFS